MMGPVVSSYCPKVYPLPITPSTHTRTIIHRMTASTVQGAYRVRGCGQVALSWPTPVRVILCVYRVIVGLGYTLAQFVNRRLEVRFLSPAPIFSRDQTTPASTPTGGGISPRRLRHHRQSCQQIDAPPCCSRRETDHKREARPSHHGNLITGSTKLNADNGVARFMPSK